MRSGKTQRKNGRKPRYGGRTIREVVEKEKDSILITVDRILALVGILAILLGVVWLVRM